MIRFFWHEGVTWNEAASEQQHTQFHLISTYNSLKLRFQFSHVDFERMILTWIITKDANVGDKIIIHYICKKSLSTVETSPWCRLYRLQPSFNGSFWYSTLLVILITNSRMALLYRETLSRKSKKKEWPCFLSICISLDFIQF